MKQAPRLTITLTPENDAIVRAMSPRVRRLLTERLNHYIKWGFERNLKPKTVPPEPDPIGAHAKKLIAKLREVA